MRDEAECPCSPKDPLPPYAPSKLSIAPSTMKAGCSYGFPQGGPWCLGQDGHGKPWGGGGG